MQQRVLRRLRVAAIESAGGQLFIGRMSVNVGAKLVVHVQNGCEGREISEKFACLIPDLPERNLSTFGKKSWARPIRGAYRLHNARCRRRERTHRRRHEYM